MSELNEAKEVKHQNYYSWKEVGKCKKCCTFLWNSETSQFLGRTGSSWAKILLFYLVFYAVLVGFFAIMMAVFYQTLDDKKPKLTLNKSVIGTNPGLSFRPMPSDSKSLLIRYNKNSEDHIQYWTQKIDKFLKVYTTMEDNENVQHCINIVSTLYNMESDLDEGKVCKFDYKDLDVCKSKNYGFDTQSPCIYLKLNRIYGWIPELYNSSTIPENLPERLKQKIRDGQNDYVWLDCHGKDPHGEDSITKFDYFPLGFHKKYFPYTNIKGYVSPIVAVQIKILKTDRLITVECKAWARNIYHNLAENRGSVRFQLMVET